MWSSEDCSNSTGITTVVLQCSLNLGLINCSVKLRISILVSCFSGKWLYTSMQGIAYPGGICQTFRSCSVVKVGWLLNIVPFNRSVWVLYLSESHWKLYIICIWPIFPRYVLKRPICPIVVEKNNELWKTVDNSKEKLQFKPQDRYETTTVYSIVVKFIHVLNITVYKTHSCVKYSHL